MRILIRRIGGMIGGILDRAFSAAGALAFSQIPAYMDQYLLFLKGMLQESRRQVESVQDRASLSGKTLQQFIDKHLASPDPDFSASGLIMKDTLQRYENYRLAVADLEHSTVFQKPFYFLYHFDFSLIKEINYTPSIPVTMEAGVYALAGLVFGLIVYTIIIWAPAQLLAPSVRRNGR